MCADYVEKPPAELGWKRREDCDIPLGEAWEDPSGKVHAMHVNSPGYAWEFTDNHGNVSYGVIGGPPPETVH